MKKLKSIGVLLFAIAICSSIYANSFTNEVPKKVQDAFIVKFPNVNTVEWGKESDKEWEAEFEIKGVEYSASFMVDGTWKETEHIISKRNIPKNIKTVLKSEFAKYKIEEAELSETTMGSVYEFELEKGKENLEVVSDMKGTILKKEVVKDEEIE